MSDFPLDDTTLALLDAACQINPDSGHTELQRFLNMTAGPVVSVTNEETGEDYPDLESALADHDGGDDPTFFVERERGQEPHSEHTVIRALIAEILRLRAASVKQERQ